MVRIPLPFTDAVLLFSPRWGDWPTPAQAALLAALLLLPALLIVLLYRFELRLVARRAAVLLLLLRLLVLALVVLLVGFQPVFARSHREELPGRVLVAVDRSDSMDVADPQRTAVDKLRLARALKLTEEGVSDDLLREWIQKLDEGAPAASLPEALTPVVRRVDALTRSDVARRLLADDGAGLLSALAAKHGVKLIGFGGEAWDVSPSALDDLFAADGKRPGSGFTDLRLPLTRALERSGGDGAKILGVVVLSDGRHDWGPSPVAKALELGEHKLPIFAVPLGDRKPPPDIAVVSVKAPPAVFKDVDTVVEARVKVGGLPEARPVRVRLERPGQEPLTETIAHDGSDRIHTVRFQTRLDTPGTQLLTVAAAAVEGETRTDNNQRSAVVNVADDKAKVLLIDGEARWEYHYLASALHRDRTIQPQSVLFQQPRLQKTSEEELRRAGHAWSSLPVEPDALAAYDAIVLGDVAPAQLPLADRVRLEKYVADRGGTLIVVAGKRALPLAYADATAGDNEPLLRLLPIETPRALRPTAGFAATPTEEGKATPFLQMEPEADKNEARWAEFPRHFWGAVGKPKPGATVLLRAAGVAGETEDPALVVRQNYGFGRVLYVGLDSTWRWRFRAGDVYHHRFWGQAVRWAASDKPLVTGNAFVRFGTRDAVHRHGQDVELIVRLTDEAGTLSPDALAGARVLRKKEGGAEEAVALVPLTRRPGQSGALDGKLRDLPPGEYEIELTIPELGDKLTPPEGGKMRATFRVAAPDGEELAELAANYPLLEELAAKSGGRTFASDEMSALIEALTRRVATREERIENPLWQAWPTLVVLLSLLTLEWVGRKWAGLP